MRPRFRFSLWIIHMTIIILNSVSPLSSDQSPNRKLLNGNCTKCRHACVPDPRNDGQFVCICRKGYFLNSDGFSCTKSPPKDLEMKVEIQTEISEESQKIVAPFDLKKSTKVSQTRSKRFTPERLKTVKPLQTLPKGKCTADSCKNNGICQTMKSTSGDNYVISCLCGLGFEGLTCERETTGVRFPKFLSNGFLAFPENILNDLDFRLSVYVKPALVMAGTVLVFKNSASKNKFLVGIDKNKFYFRIESSKMRKEIKHQRQIENSKDRWYKVEVERIQDNVRLAVDDEESSLGQLKVDKTRENLIPMSDSDEKSRKNFICDYCLFLGGHSQLMKVIRENPELFGQTENSFIGCMRHMVINGNPTDMRRMPFYGKAVGGLAIEDCSAGLCDNVNCYNGGSCMVSEDFQGNCQCPFGYIGKSCEKSIQIRMPFFNGNSVASYIGLRGTSRSENQIFIRFRPKSPSGIILYHGYSSDRRGDFLSIYLIDGYPWVSFDLGSGTVSLRSKYVLQLDKWHSIRFFRTGRKGTLVVNSESAITGYSPGSQVQLTIQQNLMLGGVDNLDNLSAYVSVKHGFNGCIQTLFVDNEEVKLIDDLKSSLNLQNYDEHACGHVPKPCWQNSVCVPYNEEFVCSCPLGYFELSCQSKIEISGIRQPYFNGSSYLVYTENQILRKFVKDFNLTMVINLRSTSPDRIIFHLIGKKASTESAVFTIATKSENGIKLQMDNVDKTLLDNLPSFSDHRIEVIKTGKQIKITFNNTFEKVIHLSHQKLSVNGFSKLFIGGVDLTTSVLLNLPVTTGTIGCIKSITINRKPLSVSDANDGRSVSDCSSQAAR